MDLPAPIGPKPYNNLLKKLSEKSRMRRRKLRAQKKNRKKMTSQHIAGSFGLSCEPEDVTETNNIPP